MMHPHWMTLAAILVIIPTQTLCFGFLAASPTLSFSSSHRPSSRFHQRQGLVPSKSTLYASFKSSEDEKDQKTATKTLPSNSNFRRICSAAIMGLFLFGFSSSNADAADKITHGKQYWSIMESSPPEEKVVANEGLFDYAVGTINTMYYDNSGGANFNPREFYDRWRLLRKVAHKEQQPQLLDANAATKQGMPIDIQFSSREGAVQGLQWLVNSLNDPYSKYLTRQDLRHELEGGQDGFLGSGAIVEAPKPTSESLATSKNPAFSPTNLLLPRHSKFLTLTRVANLPVVTAIAPDSPAERSGLTVGDRIVAVGKQEFLGRTRKEVAKILEQKYNAENYFGLADLTIAKPVFVSGSTTTTGGDSSMVVGYRRTRVNMPTKASQGATAYSARAAVAGGNNIVHYQLLTSGSIFDRNNAAASTSTTEDPSSQPRDRRVGYIRLTRFSRASTVGYLNAVQQLEAAGADSYILDLRNNYGGIIQEAMLTASTLLRDSHSIVCFTLNSRGGFQPHDVEEYVVDTRYPGYLLSREPSTVTMRQVQRESPEMFQNSGLSWSPPSSYASLQEQRMKRNILRPSEMAECYQEANLLRYPYLRAELEAQKRIVVLINEGTASAAEVFASSLHDNRRVTLIGSKTYGKGLIQHTFPMPDGGGLRLTVAEYLTPALQHVTNVGGARFDRDTGEFVGGGIRPDIVCESRQGIPGNTGADLCVGVALDALEEEDSRYQNKKPGSPSPSLLPGESTQWIVKRE
jgi:C-terminal processing protease CtpA/Prc